ncbi:MAG: phosphomethylpyrimidine synthase ThiC [Spirochaetales bacterium]|nr:phosphomethylpyrimidine synthase ThiC [Spirochaetales bacterium]
MTQLESARKGIITDEMKSVAAYENIHVQRLMENISKGYTIITKNTRHSCTPLGIGKDLKIKINANIGTSNHCKSVDIELEKLNAAVKYGSDTIMDLSTGGDLNGIRKTIIRESGVPVGTVPIYQAITEEPDVTRITEKDFLDSIFNHIQDGVDFITVHCGIKKAFIPLLSSRIMGVVSRGGSFLVKWMMHHEKENPLYTHYDEILSMAKEFDVSLSLGDGLRPGCLADATDKAQLAELDVLGELALRSQEAGVQVMIEGPGHVPLDQIKENIDLQKKACHGAPFYVLGPLVTDIAPGYDHIAGAIGGALAGFYGADFLCYLTPTEHLGLPGIPHVIDGVIASKIAAHAADIARGLPGARDPDDKMAKARSNLDWNTMFSLAMNREKAETLQKESGNTGTDVCSMCGDLCSAKINKESREGYKSTT